MSSSRARVVILGGGFAGLNAARALRRAPVDVVLIDQHNHHLFQPLLYQVATAGLSPEDITSPIRGVLARQKNARVVLGRVEWIDRERRRVGFTHGEVDYDYLVVATGMKTNYFGHGQWETDAPGLKTIADALTCRRRILEAFERAEWAEDRETKEKLLTFIVVGAGPTGVELAGAIREIAHKVMVRDFRNIDPECARVLLIDGLPRVLASYREASSIRAQRDLEKMGVDVRLNTMVEEISPRGVLVEGEWIESATVIWAAGVKATSVTAMLDTDLDALGRVQVEPDLRISGDERVFVVGDAANLEVDGSPLPGLAPVAIQQGRFVARQISRIVGGKGGPESFEYRDKGQMATIGRARAIAEFAGRTFSGFFAWVLWLFVHLLFLVGFRNRLFVVLDWFYAYMWSRRSARLILGRVVPGSAPWSPDVARTLMDYRDGDGEEAEVGADGRAPGE